MKKQQKTFINIGIDKLINLIENVASGDMFDTKVIQLLPKNAKEIKKSEWLFDWSKQLKLGDRETYKLI